MFELNQVKNLRFLLEQKHKIQLPSSMLQIAWEKITRSPITVKNRHHNIPSVQYLRGIAALMVVLFHASREVRAQIGWATFAWGEFGVDIFFNISGFVMMYSSLMAENPCSYIQFLKN